MFIYKKKLYMLKRHDLQSLMYTARIKSTEGRSEFKRHPIVKTKANIAKMITSTISFLPAVFQTRPAMQRPLVDSVLLK